MKITYDIKDLPEPKGRIGGKSVETFALIAFLADSQKGNMCFEYDTEKDAKRRYDTLRNYRNRNKLQERFDVYRVDKAVYVVKPKKAARRAGE